MTSETKLMVLAISPHSAELTVGIQQGKGPSRSPGSGSGMADVASLIDFLLELHPKSQPCFAPITPVTGLIPLIAQNHLLTSSLNVFSAGYSLCSGPNIIFPRTSPLLRTCMKSHHSHISLGFPGLTDQVLLAPSQTHVLLSPCCRNPPLHLVQ